MHRYVVLVGILAFVVEFLLILGTNRLSGYPPGVKAAAVAAAVSAMFAGAYLIPGFSFLGGGFWRMVMLGVSMILAFGVGVTALRRGMVFALLKLALHGAVTVLGNGGIGTVLLAGAGIGVLCALGLQGRGRGRELLPVELYFGDRRMKLTALRDTGNTLHDPVTGEQVLVAGADMARKLLGLTPGQLSAPVETLAAGQAPGMRLIPYRTVGQTGAMMLAMRLRDVKVGSWQGSALIAFAPETFENGEGYQMLVGGSIG